MNQNLPQAGLFRQSPHHRRRFHEIRPRSYHVCAVHAPGSASAARHQRASIKYTMK
jgi:hypothetical protein